MNELSSKDSAQRRADRIAAFRRELDALAAEGVAPIPDGDLARIIAHQDALLERFAREFDVDRTEAERRMSVGMRVASFLGAAALTAAVASFVYRVWGSMPTAGQVALVTLAPLVSVIVMGVAARLEKTRYVASLFAIVACGAFVLQTVVLGQLFNMRSSPHAILFWGLFALAVAIPWRFSVPFAFAALALTFYAPAALLHLLGYSWTTVPERPELLGVSAALGLLAVGRAPRELAELGRPVLLVVALGVLLLMTNAAPASLLPLEGAALEMTYQLLATAVTIALIVVGLRRGLNDVTVIGALFGGAFLLTRFVDWFWEWMPKYLFFLMLAALSLAWLWGLRLARRRFGERLS